MRLVLEESAPSRVPVRDPQGAPVAGARVSVVGYTQMSSTLPEQLGPAVACESDSSGMVFFEDLEWSEAHVIEVEHPDYGKQRFFRQWDGKGGETLDLFPTGRIEGVLTDEGGAPLGGVELWFRTDDAAGGPWQRRSFHAQATTAEDGRFTVPHIGSGLVLLDIVRPRGTRPKRRLRYQRQDVIAGETLILEVGTVAVPERDGPSKEAARGIVRGVVRDERGDPVAGAWVRSSASKSFGGGMTTSDHRNAITDADGSFELRELPEDSPVRLRATLGARRSELLEATPAAAPEPVILTLRAEALVAFRGRVVDERGRPDCGSPGAGVESRWNRRQPG